MVDDLKASYTLKNQNAVVTEPRKPYSKSVLETAVCDSKPDLDRKGATL